MNDTEKAKLEEYIELCNEHFKIKGVQKRIMYIGKSTWANAITKRKQTLDNLYCYADYDSWYPAILTKIRIDAYELKEVENSDGSTKKEKFYIDKECKIIEIYETIAHRNLGGEEVVAKLDVKETETTGIEIRLYGENFCTTVHGNMCFGKVEKVEKILAGQLIGQNGNSPMSSKYSVVNDKVDRPVTDTAGNILKANSDILSLITRKPIWALFQESNKLKIEYEEQLLKEDEIAIKPRGNSHYLKIKENLLGEYENVLSTYYKIITYEMQQKRLQDVQIIKKEFDMSVIGLGSAGTGVLDQVARSEYFKNYMLIDFDSVEEKNLRNQWYLSNQTGFYKTTQSENNIKRIKPTTNVESHNTKFQDVNLKTRKTKYVVSGFDNLECRKELLEKIKSGEFEAKYLIDLRYLDLACSIYFIDIEDEKQVSYYEKQLNADIKGFEEQEKQEKKYLETDEEIIEYLDKKRVFHDSCDKVSIKLFGSSMGLNGDCPGDCKSELCKNCWLKRIEENGIKIERQEENTCVKQNIIDIYKFSSSFVFSAIREIESENPKPFTHIEAQTEVLPTYTVFKK